LLVSHVVWLPHVLLPRMLLLVSHVVLPYVLLELVVWRGMLVGHVLLRDGSHVIVRTSEGLLPCHHVPL